ncbi:MAG TPA: TolC family protein [Dissulfurispiraceae bacterium]|nr:TolC family protein [Dissulfurispiraceae bacterium]
MQRAPGMMNLATGLLRKGLLVVLCAFCLSLAPSADSRADDTELNLKVLIDEALLNSPEIKASEMRAAAAGYRIPQVQSLPDPIVSFGYQNEGFSRYTYGLEQGAQWMYSVSQSFPFPGKLSLKGEATAKDAEALRETYRNAKAKTVQKVKELYYDLFLAYKTIDLIKERRVLFALIEQAAVARYAAGKGSQQDVLMAQTEKYMLLEREEMLRQKSQALQAMLNSTTGRNPAAPLARPLLTEATTFALSQSEIAAAVLSNSPDVRAKQRMIDAAGAKVKFAKKDFLPDFSLTGSYFDRKGMFLDMWSLTVAMNIPIFAATKQKQAVHEAEALLWEAERELEATKLTVLSNVQDYLSMVRTTGSLMDLYKNSLIPKTRQDIESVTAAYTAGRSDALTVISRLKSLIDLESLYWNQFTEREKAIARIEALSGIFDR